MKKAGDNIVAILLGVIIIIMFTQVIFRYIFNSSLAWSEEIAKYIFIWITFLGSALCIRDKMHLRVDYLIDKLHEKYKPYLELFNTTLITIFNGIMTVTGFYWVVEVSGTLSPAVGLPINIVFYAAFPVAAVFSFLCGLSIIKNELKNIQK